MKREVALYVHIPFCKQKCFYCDFPSFSNIDNLMDDYIEALNKEILEKASNYKIRSLFIGGGTPSYLDEKNLISLLDKINKLEFLDNAEKTIECNPGTLREEKLKIIYDRGINRLSFGLQSADNNILKSIGRVHSYEEFKENYKTARKIGFKNINIDMMFGLPKQTLDICINNLKDIIKLNPEHISFYSLIIEEGTPFCSMNDKGVLILPSEDEEREMYNKAKILLEESGYHQYEISNYSKDNKECFHNKIYWQCDEYIGVGSSASSYIEGRRIKNVDSVNTYIKNIKNNESIIEDEIINDEFDSMEEFMFMGLRMTEGISEEEFEKRFNKKVDEVYKDVIESNINKNLLSRKRGRIFLTNKGVEFSNIVMSDMIFDR